MARSTSLMLDTEDGVVFPPADLDQTRDLARFLDKHAKPALVGPDGQRVPLPEEVYRVLRQVAEAMREGKAISVAPTGLSLTTQEAADFLGVSRPTLVKLLELGAIPFEQPNRHRRIQLRDLVAYQEQRRAERRATLNRLTEEAGEAGLNEGMPEDYTSALEAARRRRAGSKAS